MFFKEKKEPKIQVTYGRDEEYFVITCSVGGEECTTLRLSPGEARRMISAYSALFNPEEFMRAEFMKILGSPPIPASDSDAVLADRIDGTPA